MKSEIQKRVETAVLRLVPRTLPEFDPHHKQILSLLGVWSALVWDYGEEHPAALGCLLGLVRLAYSDPCIHVMADDLTRWSVELDHGPFTAPGGEYVFNTELDAIICALEGAP